jgi:hypothetical protein
MSTTEKVNTDSVVFIQFVDRLLLLLMPTKYQPDFVYLRHVRTSRVHLFTVIQILCFVGMWVVKQTKVTAIAFPLMVGE